MWGREEMHTTFFSEIPIITESSNLIIVYFASFSFFSHNTYYFFNQHFCMTNKYVLGQPVSQQYFSVPLLSLSERTPLSPPTQTLLALLLFLI